MVSGAAFHLLATGTVAAATVMAAAASSELQPGAIAGGGGSSSSVWWCSWAAPGCTLLLGSTGVPVGANVKLTSLPNGEVATVSAVAEETDGAPVVTNSGSGLSVLVPATLPRAAYTVEVGGAAPFVCGAPEVWWVQGGEGNASVAGGWLRAFGRNLALLPAGSALAERQRSVEGRQLAEQAARAVRRGDWAQAGDLAAAQVAIAEASKGAHADAAINTTVTLCSTASKSKCTTLAADGSTSPWAAQFWLPQEMAPGDYVATVSHGGIGIGSGEDILLEGNRVANPSTSSMDPTGPLDAALPRVDGILVQNTTRGVVMRDNKAAATSTEL